MRHALPLAYPFEPIIERRTRPATMPTDRHLSPLAPAIPKSVQYPKTAHRTRAQSVIDKHDAWERTTRLMEEKSQHHNRTHRRARSVDSIDLLSTKSSTIRKARSVSPNLTSSLRVRTRRSSTSSSTSLDSLPDSPRSWRSTSTPSERNSRSASPVSPTETIAVTEAPYSKEIPAGGVTIDNRHMGVMYKTLHRNMICRACVERRKTLPKEKQEAFRVATFLSDTEPFTLQYHFITTHLNESIDIGTLPQSTLEQLEKEFAEKDCDEEFDMINFVQF